MKKIIITILTLSTIALHSQSYKRTDLKVNDSTLHVDATNNRVGIGTTSPSNALHINAADGFSYLRFTSNVATTGTRIGYNGDDFRIDQQQNGNIEIRTSGAERMRITSTGNVGIGTSGPNKTLTVATPQTANTVMEVLRLTGSGNYNSSGSSDAGAGISFGQYSGTFPNWNLGQISGLRSGASWDGALTFSTNNGADQTSITERMRITSTGNVGIGTTTVTEELDVDGNARFRSIGSGASSGALHYTSTGVLTTNTSDIRLKTNLQPLENTLSKLLDINTYTFNWINETDRVDLGMVAQEVEEIFPRLVFTNSVDGYKGIHYDKFSSILAKAIQEQQAIIEQQATEIETLKSQIQLILNEIEQLKNN